MDSIYAYKHVHVPHNMSATNEVRIVQSIVINAETVGA